MGALLTLRAYLRSRWAARRGRSREAFLQWQERQYHRWLAQDVPQVAAFADVGHAGLSSTDKARVMADFAAFNRPGITAAQGWAAVASTRKIGDLTIGASTGTSGNRGLFVISDAERYQWLGVILAKALPDLWRRRHRVAVILPLHTALYDSARQSRAVQLSFYDLARPMDGWLPDLILQNPTVIVAPPKVLCLLARHAPALHPLRLFAAAETLDPPDRALIEAAFAHCLAQPLGQIYMATEGLLGVTCHLGCLHLAEDVVRFDYEAVGDLVTPLISSFTRKTQILARYRMNDLLRLSAAPCPCGSPLQAVDEVVGRMDDVFYLPRRKGGQVMVTPDILRNAVLGADAAITDFRLQQMTAGQVRLTLPEGTGAAILARAVAAVGAVFSRLGAEVELAGEIRALPVEPGRKLRRVESMVHG